MDPTKMFDDIATITDPYKRICALEKYRRILKLTSDAQISKVKAARAEGEVIALDEAAAFVADSYAAFRAHMLRFADAHSHALAQLTTAAEVHAYITREARTLLRSMQDQLVAPAWAEGLTDGEAFAGSD